MCPCLSAIQYILSVLLQHETVLLFLFLLPPPILALLLIIKTRVSQMICSKEQLFKIFSAL